MTDARWVLSAIADGLGLEFESEPCFPAFPGPTKISSDLSSVCEEEVNSLEKRRRVSYSICLEQIKLTNVEKK